MEGYHMPTIMTEPELREAVKRVVAETPILDVHTHVYPPAFGELLLWGIDELLTYHYLVAEVFRAAPMDYDAWWNMPKQKQAEHIWQHLFVERSPISESCRGVLTCLKAFGLDVASRDLHAFREYFRAQNVEEHINTVFDRAGIRGVVMTNNPFDDAERAVWKAGFDPDPRFRAALRVDDLLVNPRRAAEGMKAMGYDVSDTLDNKDLATIRKFLSDWIARIGPLYMAASMAPEFMYPEDSAAGKVLEECFLPVGREHNLPFAMMIGVKKLVNPGLQLAGDSVGKARIEAVENLCVRNPDNKFLLTYLSRENQHECCVAARKFSNLHIFGCWWFLNNPSIIDCITRERLETLGISFTPQHSDARVLDQLIYKWTHSRRIIGDVLADKYADLLATGWRPTEQEIQRDVALLFGGAFEEFLRS